MKALVQASVAFLILASTVFAQNKEQAKQPLPPNYLVRMNGGGAITTGVCYSAPILYDKPGVNILTCAHGKDRKSKVLIRWPYDPRDSHGWVMGVDRKLDLAVVRVDDTWPEISSFPRILPEINDSLGPKVPILFAGYGPGENPFYWVRDGQVVEQITVTSNPDGRTRTLTSTTMVGRPGDSGGPVFCNGWLVGIHHGQLAKPEREGGSTFVGHKDIWRFLDGEDLKP